MDERVDLAPVLASWPTERVIDMDRVTRVTSAGVRKWTAVLPQITPFWLLNCRPAVVSALNIVSQFAAGGQVLSIYAPYLCPQCRLAFDVHIDLRSPFPETHAATAECPSCGCKGASFDEIASEYFSFIRAHPPGPIPRRVGRLMDAAGRVRRTGPNERLHDARVQMAEVGERLTKLLDRGRR